MEKVKESEIVYRFKNNLYINLTNRCPNLCVFCIKTKWSMRFRGHNLNLGGQEPTVPEVLTALETQFKQGPVEEVVFCGYGEATLRLTEMLEIARTLKGWAKEGKYPPFKIRLNTVGLGNLINQKNIVPQLEGFIDSLYISLNAPDKETWRRVVCPRAGFEDGFDAVVEFVKLSAKGKFDKVVATCVDKTVPDTDQVKMLAQSCGAEFQVRPFLDEEE